MTPPRIIRIGLLISGALNGPAVTAQGGFDEIYIRYWKSTVPDNCNAKIVIKSYNVTKLEFPEERLLDEHDIFMVTGSPTAAHNDAIPWVKELLAFLKGLIQNHPKVKLCGFCFGHQIICRALGGECMPNGQWEVGPTSINLSDIGRLIFGADQLSVQQVHSDHVLVESFFKQFASGELHLVGSTAPTRNQGIIRFYPTSSNGVKTPRDIHILTLQGHPEFSEPIVTELVRERVDSIGLSTLNDYWGHKGGNYDGEPEDHDGTGRRWDTTSGPDVVSHVLRGMLGVVTLAGVPSGDDSEEGNSRLSQEIIVSGAVLEVGPGLKGTLSRFWSLPSGIRFVSNLFRRIFRVASWW